MFKSAAKKLAHNTTVPALSGQQELRRLQDLITAEKAVIISLQKLSGDISTASEALKAWGLGEDDDLANTLGASATIITHFTSALLQYAAHGQTLRQQLKAIRTREEDLLDLKRKRQIVMLKTDCTQKKLRMIKQGHKCWQTLTDTLNRLRQELQGLDREIMEQKAESGDFKRAATRSCMTMKFGSLAMCCQKGLIVGQYGKLIVSEIPEEITQPGQPGSDYRGHARVEELIVEANRRVQLPVAPSWPQHRQSSPQSPATPQSPSLNNVYPPQAPGTSQPTSLNSRIFRSQPLYPPRTPDTPQPSPLNNGNVGSSSLYPVQIQALSNSHPDGAPRQGGIPDPQGSRPDSLAATSIDLTQSILTRSPPEYSGSLSRAPTFQSRLGPVDEFDIPPPNPSPPVGWNHFTTAVKNAQGQLGTNGRHQFQLDAEERDASLSSSSTPPLQKQSYPSAARASSLNNLRDENAVRSASPSQHPDLSHSTQAQKGAFHQKLSSAQDGNGRAQHFTHFTHLYTTPRGDPHGQAQTLHHRDSTLQCNDPTSFETAKEGHFFLPEIGD